MINGCITKLNCKGCLRDILVIVMSNSLINQWLNFSINENFSFFFLKEKRFERFSLTIMDIIAFKKNVV